MKILSKIKKYVIIFITFIMTIPSRVWAIMDPSQIKSSNETLYGIPSPEPKVKFEKVIYMIMLPIVLFVAIIGLTKYVKKGLDTKRRKIICGIIGTIIAIIMILELKWTASINKNIVLQFAVIPVSLFIMIIEIVKYIRNDKNKLSKKLIASLGCICLIGGLIKYLITYDSKFISTFSENIILVNIILFIIALCTYLKMSRQEIKEKIICTSVATIIGLVVLMTYMLINSIAITEIVSEAEFPMILLVNLILVQSLYFIYGNKCNVKKFIIITMIAEVFVLNMMFELSIFIVLILISILIFASFDYKE